MSPILVRPVREQLEHDRIIRQLQTKFRRKYEVGINPGPQQLVPVGVPPNSVFPDVVLMSMDRARKVQQVIEVETGESVNHLEALAEWAHFSRTRAPFHLYVPAGMVDVARRLAEDNQIYIAEIWSYHAVGDQMRFASAYRNKDAPPPPPKKPAAPKEAKAPVKTAAKAPARSPAKSTVKKPAVKKKPVAAKKKAAKKKK